MSYAYYQQWLKMGKDLGMEGEELKAFIRERQTDLREDRAKEREDKKERKFLEIKEARNKRQAEYEKEKRQADDERDKRQAEEERIKRKMEIDEERAEKERDRLAQLERVTKIIGKRIKAIVAIQNGNYSWLKELGYVFAEDELFGRLYEKISSKEPWKEKVFRDPEITPDKLNEETEVSSKLSRSHIEEVRDKRQLEEEKSKRQAEEQHTKRQLEIEEERSKRLLEENEAKCKMAEMCNKRQVDLKIQKLETEVEIQETETRIDYDLRQTEVHNHHNYVNPDTFVEPTNKYVQEKDQDSTFEGRTKGESAEVTNRDWTETETYRGTS